MDVSVCMLKDAKINEVFTHLKRAHIIKCIKSFNLILKINQRLKIKSDYTLLIW